VCYPTAAVRLKWGGKKKQASKQASKLYFVKKIYIEKTEDNLMFDVHWTVRRCDN